MWGGVWGTENKQSKQCRVDWRSEVWELKGRLKANPPVVCKVFVSVGWLSQGNTGYRFGDANPPYDYDHNWRSKPSRGLETGENKILLTNCSFKAIDRFESLDQWCRLFLFA